MKLHRVALLVVGLAVLGCDKKEAADKAAATADKAKATADKAKAGAEKAADLAEKAGAQGAADKAKAAADTAGKAGEAAAKAGEMAKAAGGEAGGSTGSAAATISPEVEKVFKTRCATCHGETGKGDGPAAAALNPKPRAYSDAAWQKSVTDDYLAKVIVEGGAAVGKSPLMAANPDLKAKPEIVKGLVAKIRSFGK